MNAIHIDDQFALIPVFTVKPIVRLVSQGFLDGGILITCELFAANLRGRSLGQGQSLCVNEDLDVYDERKGARIALGRALEDMRLHGQLNHDETDRVKDILEDALFNEEQACQPTSIVVSVVR